MAVSKYIIITCVSCGLLVIILNTVLIFVDNLVSTTGPHDASPTTLRSVNYLQEELGHQKRKWRYRPPNYRKRIQEIGLSNPYVTECKFIISEANKLSLLHKSKLPYLEGNHSALVLHGDVTLVTQLSCNRVSMILAVMNHWNGPMSVAVYCSVEGAGTFLQSVRRHSHASRIRISFVYDHIIGGNTTQKILSSYPVNYLRNVALDNALTDYVFLSDVDFIPSFGLHDYLVKSATKLIGSTVKRALVVAAFEEMEKMSDFPTSKEQLKVLFDRGVVRQFHDYFIGHHATNYAKWFEESFPYKVDWEMDYEPYVMVRNDIQLPRYNESFLGYGFNKIVHIAELQAANYEFVVLPEEFLVHRIHSTSKFKQLITNDDRVKKCMKMKYFLHLWKTLTEKYGYKWEFK